MIFQVGDRVVAESESMLRQRAWEVLENGHAGHGPRRAKSAVGGRARPQPGRSTARAVMAASPRIEHESRHRD
jgi:hypothetical protein